jgi:hypothetical protein
MRFIYLFLLSLLWLVSPAQEILTGLQVDPVIRAKSVEWKKNRDTPYLQDTTPVGLPFFDDFSKSGIYPSTDRWIDQYTFENTDYPVYPIDLGVVTLDAISDSGQMYPNAIPGPQVFIADRLTSRYIRLDSVFSPVPRALHPSDSIYLSFYYQPQGRGLPPTTSDSLVLHFLLKAGHDSILPGDTVPVHIPDIWKHVWSSRGMPLDTFYLLNNLYFKRVMIPIVDSARFFKKNFRFQFFNYVSLASDGQPSWQSNCDQWNIDNVYLNVGRTAADTIRKEIRFLERPPSMLRHYSQMPYPQYCDDPTNEIIDSLFILISNRDTVTHSSHYGYRVTQPGSSFNQSFDSIFPLTTFYQFGFPYIMRPPVPFFFPVSGSDSASFEMKHMISDLTPGSTMGDTITGYQNFYNYYAYDDGTPEAGYGLKGTGAMLAYRFSLNKSPDTLRGVRIFFNPTLSEANKQFFYLTVWNDNNGSPGDTIYSRLYYVWYPDTLNDFVSYYFERPVRVSGTFYIGMVQTTDDNLNIGFDKYNNSQENLMYNVTGEWLTSSFTGALMIRPYVGKRILIGTNDLPAFAGAMKIFPNPSTTGLATITLPGSVDQNPEGEPALLKVSNIFGQLVKEEKFSGRVDLQSLPNGIYFLEVTNGVSGKIHTGKLVITK